MRIIDAAEKYVLEFGWALIEVKHRSKLPLRTGWSRSPIPQDKIFDAFLNKDVNIGVVLGTQSGGLIDVDNDSPQALRFAKYFLEETLIFGYEGKPNGHYFYKVTNGSLPKGKSYRSPKRADGKRQTYVEIHGEGRYTMVPPSVHPNGKTLEFANDKKPSVIDGAILTRNVRDLALACLFFDHWPEVQGARQECALALAGVLLRNGFTEKEAEHFINAVTTEAGDPEVKTRVGAVKQSAKRSNSGGNTWGWPKLEELFGREVASQAAEWIGDSLSDSSAEPAVIPQSVYNKLPDRIRKATEFFPAWYKKDVFLTALLGTLSAALPNFKLLYGNVWCSAHCYFFILGEAATGKGVMRHAFAWPDRIDEEIRRRGEQSRDDWQQNLDDYKEAKSLRSRKNPSSLPITIPPHPGSKPPEQCLKAGSNTTAAALAYRIASSKYGIFIPSTEADSLTSSNRREHGDFSHIIRQSSQHEEIIVDRKSEGSYRVSEPRLALVLSGTPQQFVRLMSGGIEDGLYSRFGIFFNTGTDDFESQRPTKKDLELEVFIGESRMDTYLLFEMLRKRASALEFEVSQADWDFADTKFRQLHNQLADQHGRDLLAVVRRGELIAFRIAMVLSVWRHYEKGVDLENADSIIAERHDMEAAISLGLVYVEHSLKQALQFRKTKEGLPDMSQLGGDNRMDARERKIYEALPNTFSTSEGQKIAGDIGMSRANTDNLE